MTTGDWRSDVLKFWFGLDPDRWWTPDPELDDAIRERYIAHVCDVFIHGLRNLPQPRPGRRAVKRSGR